MSDTTTHSQDPHDPAEPSRSTVARNPLDIPASLTREDVRAIVSEELETQLSASPSADHRGIALVSADQRNWNMRRYVESYHARWGNYPDDARLAATFPSASHEERDKVLFEFVDGVRVSQFEARACVDDREVSHNSSPSVVDAGAHSVGDGPGAGDASATPATEVTLDSLIEAVTDAHVDERAASRIQCAAASNLAEADENLAYAKNQTLVAVTALSDFIIGGAA